MNVTYQNGSIVAAGKYHETAFYDMANERISVIADGKGGLSRYRLTNRSEDFIPSFLSLDLCFGGERLSPYLSKKVEMIGRMQKVILTTKQGDLTITLFLAKEVNGVFFLLEGAAPIDLCLNCRGAKSESVANTLCVAGENFMLSSSAEGEWVKENDCFYTSAEGKIKLLLSFACDQEEHNAAFAAFDELYQCALSETKMPIPSSVTSEEEKAMYLSAYFTAIENYKKAGEFRAFAAGVNYTDPLRTYYRDSYFTVLPLLTTHPEMVRNELLTLARGVGKDGSCPSAVKSDFTLFWGDHYDSPCFFILEVYDYIHATGDNGILTEQVDGVSILTLIKTILKRLTSMTDQQGLLYKEGAYNKRDWADEVNRSGYVTFVEVLYYRALVVASRLFSDDPTESSLYQKQAELVKKAINDILFDEEKGYYLNYKSTEQIEDNLSADTLFALLFGVADGERAKRVLDNMESLLESKNNSEQGGGDFGVMCVYPPYKLPKSTCHKSSRLYDYHNGANWCYLTAMYAYAKSLYGRDWRSPLLSTFRYMTQNGHYTPLEYFSPACPAGSALQGWSAAIAFVWQHVGENNFFE